MERLTPQQSQLVADNLGLAYEVALQFGRGRSQLEREWIEDAALGGLLYAATKYDANRGVRFSTYATVAAKNKVLSLFRSSGWKAGRVVRTAPKRREYQRENPLSPVAPAVDTGEDAEYAAVVVRRLLLRLTPEESEVVTAKFGVGREAQSLTELARERQTAKHRLHVRFREAMQKLREWAEDSRLCG